MLLAIPATCIGQSDKPDVKKEIGEAVFRYEFEHFIKDESPRIQKFLPSHYAIHSERDFLIDEAYLAKFSNIYPKVIKYIPPTSCVSPCKPSGEGKYTCPLKIIITGIKFISQDKAEVYSSISFTVEGRVWEGIYTVEKQFDHWSVKKTRSIRASADC